jgi:hypothetical protein
MIIGFTIKNKFYSIRERYKGKATPEMVFSAIAREYGTDFAISNKWKINYKPPIKNEKQRI